MGGEVNIEYRMLNFESRSFITILVPFDIRHSLFDILRFTVKLRCSSHGFALYRVPCTF
jgi:hypothetical protein